MNEFFYTFFKLLCDLVFVQRKAAGHIGGVFYTVFAPFLYSYEFTHLRKILTKNPVSRARLCIKVRIIGITLY